MVPRTCSSGLSKLTSGYMFLREKSTITDQENKEQSSKQLSLHVTGPPGRYHCRNGSQSALASSEAIYTPTGHSSS
jgi:hypothetical protein